MEKRGVNKRDDGARLRESEKNRGRNWMPGEDGSDKLLVASEYADPCFHVGRVIRRVEDHIDREGGFGLLLITKNIKDSTPIWQYAVAHSIPTIVHVTITGLGGSKLEPNVPQWTEEMHHFGKFIKMCNDEPFSLENIVLRIDPLVPRYTDFDILDKIIPLASAMGVKRIRTSIVDYYPFVRDKFASAGLKMDGNGFQPSMETKVSMLQELIKISNKYEMSVESCAENITIEGLSLIGCANLAEWRMLGLNLPCGSPKREGCFCNVRKIDVLPREGYCGHGCVYCYWGKYRK